MAVSSSSYTTALLLGCSGCTTEYPSSACLYSTRILQKLQAGHADVQDSADVSIVVRPTAACAISMDIICQTIVQHCSTSDLELTATCCVKLQLSPLSNPDLKFICFVLLSANCSTYLFCQHLCSRVTALWRYINFVLLLLLLLL